MPKYNTPALQYKTEFFGRRAKGGKYIKDLDVLIVDGMPGLGKTSAMINYINGSPDNIHFIYVTPYLNEVERIIKECPSKNFKQPTTKNSTGTKIGDLERLIDKHENIVTTHALLNVLGHKTLALLNTNNYILVLDEVPEVVQFVTIPNDADLNTLFKDFAKLDENNKVIWTDSDYEKSGKGFFSEIKQYCEVGALYYYPNTNKFMVWTFPIDIFKSFNKNFVITYMFDGQIQSAYYRMHGVQYKYVHIRRGLPDGTAEKYNTKNFNFEDEIFDEPQFFDCSQYKKLIHVCDSEKLNAIGSENKKQKTDLSASWYQKAAVNDNGIDLKILKNGTYNYFNNIMESSANDNMWTTFKPFKAEMAGKGYTKGFVSCTARATNEYREKRCLAYLINRFPNPNIINFFAKFGVSLDLDKFALSEMIQWIFRSRIRTGQDIHLYLPSLRMRELLEAWMNNEMNNATDFTNVGKAENYEEYQQSLNDLDESTNRLKQGATEDALFDMEF